MLGYKNSNYDQAEAPSGLTI